MTYKTEQTGNGTTRYTFYFEDYTSCIFSVSKGGIIDIIFKEHILEEFLCEALKKVTDKVIEEDMIPKINIKNTNSFLKNVVKRCAYRKLPCQGISFSIWTFP